MTPSLDYRSENGVILYTCPADMATVDNGTIQNVTCTRRFTKFVFLPKTVQECLVCIAEPIVSNATTDWDQTTVWYIGDNVTATCLDKYHLHGDVVSQTLTCTATGWEEVEGCVLIPVCYGEPPPAPSPHMTNVTSVDFRNATGTVTYTCPDLMGTRDGRSEQVVTCSETPTEYVFLPASVEDCDVCIAEPIVSNATTDWDQTTVWYIGDNVTATCLDKYHLHGDVVSQTLTCTATGWEEVEGCVLIPVCYGEPPPAPSPHMTNVTSVDFRNATGTVTYTCPDLMGTRDGRSEQVVTCSETPTEYVFLPASVEDCDVCLGEPTAANATTDWAAATLYLIGQAVTATCLQGHLTDGDSASKNLSCTSTGWEAVGGCYLACVSAPPSAGENMVRDEHNSSGVGSVIHYVCSPGFLLKQYGEPKNARRSCAEMMRRGRSLTKHWLVLIPSGRSQRHPTAP
ncbi:complement factor H-like [Penaeus chinensis]|uniref:complement factor H-like n=1 Tax=Penaeus chinensis TaxID=139456 RepID=UPI001FB841FA|nr:complement factor H-like [Penaeus chinensis]